MKLEEKWQEALSVCVEATNFQTLLSMVEKEYELKTVFPPREKIFRAFELCPYGKLKVVILGQDPYHGAGQADGLSFSVPDGVKEPRSLQNIKKEILSDIGATTLVGGNLESLSMQGVLLLNTIMTVLASSPASHRDFGWENFTDCIIKTISEKQEHVVFVLWGNYAKQKQSLIDEKKHLILTSPHPSPFSARTGFFGCKHFSKANNYLKLHGKTEINW